jgi:DNA-3-methyladenine glycosylase
VRVDADGLRVGCIVEVEAYGGPEDRASHARPGRTVRNAAMFGPGGHAYVYRVYGMHLCLNVVSGVDGDASAILVRALQPLAGIDAMRRARVAAAAAGRRIPDASREAADRVRIAVLPAHRLASGPGLVGAAFSVEPSMSGTDLCDADGPLRLRMPAAGMPRGRLLSGPRVGVAYAGAPWALVPWRFALAGHAAVSRPLPAVREP